MLVTNVDVGGSGAGILCERDVLLEIDGVRIANDGTCRCFGIRVALNAVLHRRYLGESATIRLLRDGSELAVEVPLRRSAALVPRGQWDCPAPYYVLGGLVFQPLSLEFLSTWGDEPAPSHLEHWCDQLPTDTTRYVQIRPDTPRYAKIRPDMQIRPDGSCGRSMAALLRWVGARGVLILVLMLC